MKKLILICGGVAVLSACSLFNQKSEGIIDRKNPIVAAMFACSAGIVSKYKLSGSIESDLEKAVLNKKLNLKVESEVEDWLKGYIFERVTEANALEAYRLYLDCYKNERKRQDAGLDSRLIPIKERTQFLWNKYDEAIKYGHRLTLSDAEQYAVVAASLAGLNEVDLDHKNNIIKFDRQSLMYFLAAEIIISQENNSDFVANRSTAIDYSSRALGAARATERHYQLLINSAASVADTDWLTRQNIRMVVLDRLAQSQAQQLHLGIGSVVQVNRALELLPCDYIARYGFANDRVYTRIQTPARFTQCRSTAQ